MRLFELMEQAVAPFWRVSGSHRCSLRVSYCKELTDSARHSSMMPKESRAWAEPS